MINENKLIIWLTIAAIIVNLLICTIYQHSEIKAYRVQIYAYQMQITNLQLEASEQSKRYDAAFKQADFEMRQIQDKSKKILMAKVPQNCKEAIAWGINEAHTFE
jgi:hypothetical protein